MANRYHSIVVFLFVRILLATSVAAASGDKAIRSPFDVSFAPQKAAVAVSDRTAGVAYLIDLAGSNHRIITVPLHGQPTGTAWIDNRRAVVAEYDAGTLAEVLHENGTATVGRRFQVGPKPLGVAVAPRRQLVASCDFALHSLFLIDLTTGSQVATVPVGKHPYFVAITRDERLAIVADLLPAGAASNPTSAASIHLVDLESQQATREISLPAGSSNVRQVTVSPNDRWAYVVHTVGRVALPTTQLERGWVNTNAVTIVDLQAHTRYATLLLDYVTQGAADPWGIALTDDGGVAWITLAGIHQVARLDLEELHRLLDGSADIEHLAFDNYSGSSGEIWRAIRDGTASRDALTSHLSALYGAGIISRVDINGTAPRGIAASSDGNLLAIGNYFSGSLTLLNAENGHVVRTMKLGPQMPATAARRGEIAFHDANECFQSWLSCATCHPDGQADGLNWDLLNDGVGNPKNTKSLLWSYQTPPMMATGIRKDMETAVRKGFQFAHFRVPEESTVQDVMAYLEAMKPEQNPHQQQPESEQRLRGEALFHDPGIGCAKCHPGPLFTDLSSHDVGTRHSRDRTGRFDTPALVDLWRTGPYLHDGSAASLREVLVEFNQDDQHGKTSHLSAQDRDALVEYLLSK